jgi:hypothetical protein
VFLSLTVAFPSFRDWSCGSGGKYERQTRPRAKATFQWLSLCFGKMVQRSMLGLKKCSTPHFEIQSLVLTFERDGSHCHCSYGRSSTS